MAPLELRDLKTKFQEQLNKCVIHLNASTYGALIIFVIKKDCSLTMCIDYGYLSIITVKNKYPLLFINNLFDPLQGA